jgi:hypothetical protein
MNDHAVESNNEVKMTKQEIIEMIECAGFEAVERDIVYNRIEKLAAQIDGFSVIISEVEGMEYVCSWRSRDHRTGA